MTSPAVETAQSLTMTHMRRFSMDFTVWSSVSVGHQPGPSTGARTRTLAEANVRPRRIVNKQAQDKTRRSRTHAQNDTLSQIDLTNTRKWRVRAVFLFWSELVIVITMIFIKFEHGA